MTSLKPMSPVEHIAVGNVEAVGGWLIISEILVWGQWYLFLFSLGLAGQVGQEDSHLPKYSTLPL